MKGPRRTASMALYVALAQAAFGVPAEAQSSPSPGAPLALEVSELGEAASVADPRSAADLLHVEVVDGELRIPEFEELVEPAAAPSPPPETAAPAPPPVKDVRFALRRIPQIRDPEIIRHVTEACAYYRVDRDLVLCLVNQESGGRQYALSHAGASGVMQLMPDTARRFGVTDIWDKRQNIWAGVRYLRLLLNMFSDSVPLALAGYNAGEHRVLRAGYRVPRIEETVNYVRAITGRYGRLKHVYPADAVTIAAPLNWQPAR
jgi:soluble lytic murein transglycosylase-like protein